jgi:hypothetical protein
MKAHSSLGGLAMDPFLETFWNLDQVHGWAETRDPEYVRAAALPRYGKPKKWIEIAIRVTHSATAALRERRDIGAELWSASGWTPTTATFVAPQIVKDYADKRGKPAYEVYRYKDLQVHWPWNPAARALSHDWKFASELDRALAVEITLDHFEDNPGLLSDPRLEKLTPKLARILREAVSSAVHGPPHVFIREPFPTLDYLRHLFEQARLEAVANRPSDPEAKVISTIDWSGLVITVGGEDERLSVWMRGNVGTKGRGAYENVRVARDDVLREFPVEPSEDEDLEPAAVSDEQVRELIRAVMVSMGGFIGQAEGASVVRGEFPNVTRDRAKVGEASYWKRQARSQRASKAKSTSEPRSVPQESRP